MKNDKERNRFSQRTMFWKRLLPMLNFLTAKGIQKLYTLNCSHKCPCTFPHSYELLRHLVFEKNHLM